MEKKKFQITLNDRLLLFLERLSRKKGLSKSAIIAIAIEKYYNEEEGTKE